ncbi:hypothetical protein AURDEDRAFT_174544 [Auricularia subglabra TFB-10046 SS5]|uniref:Uncharacterized protein n=1 Tax=Auricularia subglabra (strain TFB-10046 / SS5) TaxID=717982 RepID=J0D9F7_AURST|nr:hypothetical protein AURDEDRAFT_174544 [Auricularia subglabra TFB-10046 SS5]
MPTDTQSASDSAMQGNMSTPPGPSAHNLEVPRESANPTTTADTATVTTAIPGLELALPTMTNNADTTGSINAATGPEACVTKKKTKPRKATGPKQERAMNYSLIYKYGAGMESKEPLLLCFAVDEIARQFAALTDPFVEAPTTGQEDTIRTLADSNAALACEREEALKENEKLQRAKEEALKEKAELQRQIDELKAAKKL